MPEQTAERKSVSGRLRLVQDEPASFPAFPESARPEPESPARKTFIHAVALGCLALTAAYLTWRLLATIDLSVWWLALPLFAAEVHNGFGLALYTLALWDIDTSPAWHPVDRSGLRLAVLIPSYNEPEEVLLPTIAAAVALEPAHETWVLDDGQRDWLRELAEEMGASYLSRPNNRDAKAGNLNNALTVVDVDVIGVLDADHVAGPNFLRHTLCYFDDPNVAFVQTPQDFYNQESFEHESGPGRPFNEEAVFYRVIAPAKNLWGAPFWCGTSALIRTEAIRSVGGVATTSLTEDIHTTIRMNRGGWHGVYHNEVLARGLAPADAVQYMIQRNRWAIGAMQVLRNENPLTASGLTFGQRLGFMTTLIGWFDSWRTLAFVLLPAAVLLTDASPIHAPGYLYGPFFAATFSVQFFALRVLARGYYPPLLSLLFEFLRMPAVLPATLALVFPGRWRAFKATPKGVSASRRRTPVPPLLIGLAVLSAVSILWFAATTAGLTTMTYHHKPAVIGSAFFAVMNFGLLISAIRRVRDARFAGERRASVRFEVKLRGSLGRRRCQIVDLSLTGAKVYVASGGEFRTGRSVLSLDLGRGRVSVDVEVQRRYPAGAGTRLGVKFLPGQRRKIGQIALALLNSGYKTSPAPADELQLAA